MNGFGSLDAKLRDAAEFLNAGQKKEARKVLREALAMDRNNLGTWELLWRATYNVKEEMHCLNRILAIDPNHAAAKRRREAIRSSSNSRPRPASSRRKRRESLLLLLFLGSLVSIVCLGVAGFALLRGGYLPFAFGTNLTATAIAQKNASCQVLIEKAIQASGGYCGNTESNKACYGNTTIKAELVPGSTERFSDPGDIISIGGISRLIASPLNPDGNEWGIAVFKLIANLPRSLPGETVTMVIFGNTTLDNASGGSDSLESFYFTSELGQIVCEKVPFDGLMIDSPTGNGIRFQVNGAELTLKGSASIKAVKNGEMEVSVYKGSARIVSNGEEQYVGAGSKSSVQLGGEDGNQAISGPSEPESLSQQELDVACTMTGQFCTADSIIPVSGTEAQAQIESEITSTPDQSFTATVTPIPSATLIPTNTLFVLPPATSSFTPTPVRTSTRRPTATRTNAPPRTSTNTPTATNTPTRTNTPTPTNTPVTPTLTFTPITPSPTNTPEGCINVSLGSITVQNTNELWMGITNNSGGTITLDRFFASWQEYIPSQKIDRLLLDGNELWNTSDVNSPTDIPAESAWNGSADRTIAAGVTRTFVVRFQNAPQSPTKVHLVFDIGCQVTDTK